LGFGGLEYGVWGLGYVVRGFEVWVLGFGNQSLEFGGWGWTSKSAVLFAARPRSPNPERERERERAREQERKATQHKQWLRERRGTCTLPEVGLALDVLLTATRKGWGWTSKSAVLCIATQHRHPKPQAANGVVVPSHTSNRHFRLPHTPLVPSHTTLAAHNTALLEVLPLKTTTITTTTTTSIRNHRRPTSFWVGMSARRHFWFSLWGWYVKTGI